MANELPYKIPSKSRTNKPRNGLLTNGFREYLESGKTGYADSTQSDYDQQIKERLHNTILDFKLLFEHWDESKREELFQETNTGELFNGLACFIAMLYMENRFESGMQTLLFQGVYKAEDKMAESDLVSPPKVDLEIEPVGSADFKDAIKKFKRSNLNDMTHEEAHAILSLLRKSRTVRSQDLWEMRDDVVEQMDEMIEQFEQARYEIGEYKREKQARYNQADNEG